MRKLIRHIERLLEYGYYIPERGIKLSELYNSIENNIHGCCSIFNDRMMGEGYDSWIAYGMLKNIRYFRGNRERFEGLLLYI